MALKKSLYALGQKPAPVAGCAGTVVVQRVRYPVSSALAVGDIVELGVLPSYNYLIGATLYVDGVPAGSLGDVTVLTGTPDDSDTGRQAGATPILTNSTLNTAGRLLAPVEFNRGIGVTVGTAIAANPAQAILLDLLYAQG